jgi:hypothetical protein
MSRRGRDGRQAWRENYPAFTKSITHQIHEDVARRQEPPEVNR